MNSMEKGKSSLEHSIMYEADWTLSCKDQIESIEGNFRMRAFLATMGFNSIMTICMSVIVFCSFSIVAHFRLEKF